MILGAMDEDSWSSEVIWDKIKRFLEYLKIYLDFTDFYLFNIIKANVCMLLFVCFFFTAQGLIRFGWNLDGARLYPD